jgi:hypothetical protein
LPWKQSYAKYNKQNKKTLVNKNLEGLTIDFDEKEKKYFTPFFLQPNKQNTKKKS